MSNPQRRTNVAGSPAAIVAGEVPASNTGNSPPEWIKVTPRGQAPTRDGRNYGFDPEVLTARFTSDAVDIAVDTNHGLALRGARGEDVEPIGYAAELQARSDGTWARINWLDPEAAAAVVRKHRYVSPTFFPDANGQAVWLHSISLVSTPALSMPALAFAQGPAMETLGAVAQALGLPVTAEAPAYLSAIEGLASAHARLAALEAANHQSAVASLMEGALRARKIVPAERDEYVALCSTAEGFAQVQRLFDRKVPFLQPSGLDSRTEPSAGDAGETPQMLAARATRYREEQSRAGATLSQSEAITFAHAHPNAGR